MLDIRILSLALSLPEITAIAASQQCHSQCPAACLGPGPAACSDFIQLIDANVPWHSDMSVFMWRREDPHLQGRVGATSVLSFSGWYYTEAFHSKWITFIRAQNIDANGYELGARLLMLSTNLLSNGLTICYDTSVYNCNCGLDLPVFSTNPAGHWLYTTLSVSMYATNNHYVQCYYIYGIEHSWHCETLTVDGYMPQFGTVPGAYVAIGDPIDHTLSIIGLVADVKFFPHSALNEAEFRAILDSKLNSCPENCNSCLNPFACTVCSTGFFLSSGQCIHCNSCCAACIGPGPLQCITCTIGCQFKAPNTCLKCALGCLTCSGDEAWECIECGDGYYREFYSRICVLVCPTGFYRGEKECLPLDSLSIVDLVFRNIGKKYISHNFGVNFGAGNGFFPPTFSSDQPIPSKHRGLYFSGTQFLQLLPSNALLLAPSLTIETWIRPQDSGIRTILSKSFECLSVFTLRINNSGNVEIATEFSIISDGPPLVGNRWTHVAVTVAFASYSEDTGIAFYQNGLQTSAFQIMYMWDRRLTASYNIGRNGESGYFKGFIWSVSLYNSVLSASDIAGKVTSVGCPSGLSFCLSPAVFLQTAEGMACLPACVYGCVRTTDCSLCAEKLCSVCADFETTLLTCRNEESCSCLYGGFRV